MKAIERERHDWIVIAIILVIGFLFVIAAAQWALRFAPRWQLAADMRSRIDPDSDFLTHKPENFIEPVNPSILTQPAWANSFLTPGADFVTGTPVPADTATPPQTLTAVTLATNTTIVTTSPTNTVVPVIWMPSSTAKPENTDISAATYTTTPTFTSTPTETYTLVATTTHTSTSTATFTPTSTSDPGEPDFGGADGNTTTLGNGASVVFNLSGFSLDEGSTDFDVVYYEKEENTSAQKIHLGKVRIEVYDESRTAWYTIYHWGDGIQDINASYSNKNTEPDGFPVEKSLLIGAMPWNTGIAIDIDAPSIAQGGSHGNAITQIRITSLSDADCQVDALQMLR